MEWAEKLKDRPELLFAVVVITIVLGLVWKIMSRLMDELTLMRQANASLTEAVKESSRIQGSNVQILDYLLKRRKGVDQ
jgi:hypothetical protein